jgi:hypothetical protein
MKQGQLRFSAAGPGRTRIDYALELKKASVLLSFAVAVQAIGLVVLLGGFLVINTWVVNNADPNVRAQSFQMFQAMHFLWPPFLLTGLYRAGRRMVVTNIDLLINNLPYHAKD